MSLTDTSKSFEAAVIGGGPAGLAAAIALAQNSVATVLIARKTPYSDNRTTALLGDSVEWLTSHGIWPRCEDRAAPLRMMRLVDDTGRLLRAPETRFDCHEIGLETFGYNIENHHLVAAMEARAAELPTLTRIDDVVSDVRSNPEHVLLATAGQDSVVVKIAIGADGRQSRCREAAGISVRKRALPQAALTFNIVHSRSHNDISTEFHTAEGPCVLVPLPGLRSSVVWVASPSHIEKLHAMTDTELGEAIERQSHSILGPLSVEPGRSLFALSQEQPNKIAQNRIALVGEAAHVFPPIGAQGLNLGLRDADAIAEIVSTAQKLGEDIGGPVVLQRYDHSRRFDIATRSLFIDVANRVLLSDFLPVQALRAVGMEAINRVPPLRRFAMRQGLSVTMRSD